VTNKRGGWCFEQNTLFHFVLKEVGFEVRRGLARITFASLLRNHCFNLGEREINDE